MDLFQEIEYLKIQNPNLSAVSKSQFEGQNPSPELRPKSPIQFQSPNPSPIFDPIVDTCPIIIDPAKTNSETLW